MINYFHWLNCFNLIRDWNLNRYLFDYILIYRLWYDDFFNNFNEIFLYLWDHNWNLFNNFLYNINDYFFRYLYYVVVRYWHFSLNRNFYFNRVRYLFILVKFLGL